MSRDECQKRRRLFYIILTYDLHILSFIVCQFMICILEFKKVTRDHDSIVGFGFMLYHGS